jgi:biopolymer transport protein ExbD
MSIGSRKAGKVTCCPACSAMITVPFESGEFESPLEKLWKHADEQAAAAETDQPSAGATPGLPSEGDEAAADLQTKPTAIDDDTDLVMRRAQTEFEQMDLTPMVDVTFLLLIFFMITASFSLQKTIQVPPPDPDETGATQSIERIEDLLDQSIKVAIDENNGISIDDVELLDPAGLVDAIRTRMRTDLKTELVIAADARARHETVVTVVDAGHEVGMQKIRLATAANVE